MKQSKITLVFDNSIEGLTFHDLGIKIKYLDDEMIPHIIDLGNSAQRIHTIYSYREHVEIAWQGKKKFTRNFLFTNGDSVHLTLKDNWIYAQIMNREVDDYEINFERRMNNDLYGAKSSVLEKFYNYWNFINVDKSLIVDSDIINEFDVLKEKAIYEIQEENSYIDSLKISGILSNEQAHFSQIKNTFIERKLDIYQVGKIDFSNIQLLKHLFDFDNYSLLDTTENMARYTFYDDILIRLHERLLAKNSITQDSIMSIEWLPIQARQSLVFKHLDHILKTSSVNEGNTLINTLVESNTTFRNWKTYFTKEYNLDQQIDGSWKLRDQAGVSLTFNELLRYYEGKWVYIDLWAGWCVPCIKEMPESKKLSLAYSGKPVRFIYLSIDNSIEKWKWSDKKYIDFANGNSFYIDSLNQEKIKKVIHLNSIPRYLLFDRNGKLIHQNAPRPGSIEIRNLLDNNL